MEAMEALNASWLYEVRWEYLRVPYLLIIHASYKFFCFVDMLH